MLTGFERSETDIKARSDGENRVMKDYLREYFPVSPFFISSRRHFTYFKCIGRLAACLGDSYNHSRWTGDRKERIVAGWTARTVRMKQ